MNLRTDDHVEVEISSGKYFSTLSKIKVEKVLSYGIKLYIFNWS
jgi:hypothetical protein